jgi:hypothetical protein
MHEQAYPARLQYITFSHRNSTLRHKILHSTIPCLESVRLQINFPAKIFLNYVNPGLGSSFKSSGLEFLVHELACFFPTAYQRGSDTVAEYIGCTTPHIQNLIDGQQQQ